MAWLGLELQFLPYQLEKIVIVVASACAGATCGLMPG